MTINVALSCGSVIAGKAQSLTALRQQLLANELPSSPLPCEAPASWPWAKVLMADEPKASDLGVCRKTLRTMEKQAKLILFGAQLADLHASIECTPATTGLYLSIPTVDEAVPPWPLLEAMDEYRYTIENADQWLTGEFLTREIPAFFGLSTLNSNSCAYISAQFNLTGEMAAYSTYADASLQALIDGCLSVAEQTNSHAMIGAVGPKVNPLLLLQYDYRQYQGTFSQAPAEGAAFVWAGENAQDTQAVFSGFARGFIAPSEDKPQCIKRLINNALTMAGIDFKALDWFACAGVKEEKECIAAHVDAPDSIIFDPYVAFGNAGAATPIVALNMAVAAIASGQTLVHADTESGVAEIVKDMRHIAISAMGPEGQYVVVIISRSQP